jgi:hypothetical protein
LLSAILLASSENRVAPAAAPTTTATGLRPICVRYFEVAGGLLLLLFVLLLLLPPAVVGGLLLLFVLLLLLLLLLFTQLLVVAGGLFELFPLLTHCTLKLASIIGAGAVGEELHPANAIAVNTTEMRVSFMAGLR